MPACPLLQLPPRARAGLQMRSCGGDADEWKRICSIGAPVPHAGPVRLRARGRGRERGQGEAGEMRETAGQMRETARERPRERPREGAR